MKLKLLAGVATATALLATGASAQSWTGNAFGWFDPGQIYVGVDGGYQYQPNILGGSTAIGADGRPYHWTFKAKDGYDVFGRVGYRFTPNWRAELEYGYHDSDGFDRIGANGSGSSAQPLGLCAPGPVRGAGSTCGKPSGHQIGTTVMLNGFYDFLPDSRIRPFIGGGVGYADVLTSAYGQLSGVPTGAAAIQNTSIDGDKQAFAYQGLVGVSYQVTPQIAIDLTGRYLKTDRFDLGSVSSNVGAAGRGVTDVGTFRGSYENESVTVGVRYAFGGPRRRRRRLPRRLPASAATPPPPPPPVAPAAESRQFVVYFPFDKSILTADAQTVVQQAADYAKQGGPAQIVVVGHTDTSGGVAYNLRLSERRAKVVADAMVALGVQQSTLSVDWKGKTDLAVATPDGTKEPLNRRSTISINFQGSAPAAAQ